MRGNLGDLYSQYMLERQGAYIIQVEKGFLVYKITGDECFIAEVFVDESGRGKNQIDQLIAQASSLGVLNKCKFLTANIFTADPGATRTLRAALRLGFKVVAANGNCLFISKDVTGEA